MIALSAAAAFAATAVLTPMLAAWARRRGLLDNPNHRSSHIIATPRLGGTAIGLGFATGLAVLFATGHGIGPNGLVVLAGAFCIALLGLADDLRVMENAGLRLVAQAGVALTVVFATSLPIHAGWAVALVVAFWLVALTNAYNFMDGIDGIAGAQALVAGAGWALVGSFAGEAMPGTLGLLLAAVAAAFLLYNWHPARVFMGDAGSGFCGFLFAALPLAAAPVAGPPSPLLWACAALVVWPFIADTSFTLLRRALRRENILAAHRSHVYQRLVIAGLSHRSVALLYVALAGLGVMAALAIVARADALALAAVCGICAAASVVWTYTVALEGAHPTGIGRTPH